MKKRMYSVWDVLYPILFYYVISAFVFFALDLILGQAQEIYMLKQLISSASTIPFLLSLWKQDVYAERVVYGEVKKDIRQTLMQGMFVCVATGALGAALNNFIVMTPLVEVSAGFKEANANFFAGGMLLEVLASCVVVPVAEEVLFRGIVRKRISVIAGKRMGIVFSAVLFGVIHMNLVQFLYAAMLGLLLAVIAVKTGKLFMAVLGHSAANLIAIWRAETGALEFAYEPDFAGISFSFLLAAIGVAALGCLFVRESIAKNKDS